MEVDPLRSNSFFIKNSTLQGATTAGHELQATTLAAARPMTQDLLVYKFQNFVIGQIDNSDARDLRFRFFKFFYGLCPCSHIIF